MKILSIFVVVLVIIGGGWLLISDRGGEEIMNDEVFVSDESNVIGEENIVSERGFYGDYSEDKLALAEEGDVVLFFQASWCPSCRVLDRDIQANLDQLPEDLAILRLDYDTEIDMRRKYGVTTQHTLVQVDAEGNEIKKWSGGNTLNSIISNLN